MTPMTPQEAWAIAPKRISIHQLNDNVLHSDEATWCSECVALSLSRTVEWVGPIPNGGCVLVRCDRCRGPIAAVAYGYWRYPAGAHA